MWHAETASAGQSGDATRDQPKHFHVTLFRRLEKKLHAQAHPKHRLPQVPHGLD
jgi:hypothetical protein